MGIDKHFVTHPELRRYFYEPGQGSPYPREDGRIRNEALATAELVIDFADDVSAYTRTDMMNPDDVKGWAAIVRAYFKESAVTRQMWARYYDSYDKATACILDAPHPVAMGHWDWEANSPQPKWRAGCV